MSYNELAVINWEKEADRQLSLVIGGYNSNWEYYEDGEWRDEIINVVLCCYKDALSSYKKYGAEKNVYLTDEDILQETMSISAEAAANVAILHFNNSERFEEERNACMTEDEISNILCDLENEIIECESCAYSPYGFNDSVYDILKENRMCYVSIEGSDYNQNILGVLNDAQNALFEECLMAGDASEILSQYEDPYLFVRYPQKMLELGSGR